MKIAFITESLIPSTAANVVQTLHMANATALSGHKVCVFTPWHKKHVRNAAEKMQLKKDFSLDGEMDIYTLPFLSLGGRLKASFGVTSVLASRLLRSDVVYVRSPRIGLWAAQAGCSVLWESHTLPSSSAGLNAARKLIKHRNLAQWIFVSERLRTLYSEQFAMHAEQSLVAHDAVDLQRFTPGYTKEEARTLLKWTRANPLVLHSGHLYAGRGAELVIEASRALPQVDFAFVGGAPADIERLTRFAGEVGSKNVFFLGHQPVRDVPLFLFSADVLIMPYTSRTVVSDGKTATIEYASPMKLFEYLAAERPIVSTHFPAIAEVLQHRQNSFLVSPDSVEELMNGVRFALDHADESARWARQARVDAENHTWIARSKKVFSLFAEP